MGYVSGIYRRKNSLIFTLGEGLLVKNLLQPQGKPRPFTTPIVWSEQREMLDAMRQFRAAMALGEADAARRHRHVMGQVSGDPAEDVRAAREAAWYARSLSLADAYIERLARAISERPQGKGGWQVASQLERMYAEFAAHHDNPPPGMAVEVEQKTESQSQTEGK